MTTSNKPKSFDYVDTEIMSKNNRKAFKSAAHSMGIAVGLFLLKPFLPEIGSPEKHEQMMHLFNMTALMLFLYSIAIAIVFFFLRSNLKPLLFILNFFVAPSIVLWVFTQGYSILAK